MSFEDLKAEVDKLSVDEQNKIAAYLTHLRHQRDPELAEPGEPEWITAAELKKRWGDE